MTKRILAVTSGRADGSPMAPVVDALRERGCEIRIADCSTIGYAWVARQIDRNLVEFGKPDMGLLLGDRHESLEAAVPMAIHGIPIAHIHGGERTLGSVDDKYRDAITMLAEYHFVAYDAAFERVVRMTQDQTASVWCTGAPGLDNVARIMAETWHDQAPSPYFVLTYHPCIGGDVRPVLEALDRFPDHRVIWTGANNDPGADEIERAVEAWGKADIRRDLGADDYLRLARGAAALVGNSSAAIIEGPALRVPSVDVGDRQKGRPHGSSVFMVDGGSADLISVRIGTALRYKGPWDNPYGGPGASARIAEVIAGLEL